jgi:TolA-binding protein/DNA-binding beta-propeller fold protein YncE
MLLFILSGTCLAADAAAEKTRFDYAFSLYSQGTYDPAVKEFKEYIKEYPKGIYTDDAMYWLGKYYMMAGQYEDGFEQFKAILAQLPGGDMAPQAQYEMAGYWYNPETPAHDYQKAMAEYLKIPFFYPDSHLVDDSKYYATLCQLKLGNYSRAEEEFLALAEKSPASPLVPPALYHLGLAYLLEGKTVEALASFQEVKDRHPSGLYSNRAQDSIEMVIRVRDKKELRAVTYTGAKGSAPGSFVKPSDIAIDPEGMVYVSDSSNSRIQRFRFDGARLSIDSAGIVMPAVEKGLLPQKPAGIAIGPKGLIYITDPALNRVQVFQKDGKSLMVIGKRGAGPGEFESPAGIAVDESGNIYVANRGNKRVDKFDAFGRFVRSIGNTGPEENLLRAPYGVAIDLQGNIIVTDDSADRVMKFDGAGKLLLSYSNRPENKFILDEPAGVCTDTVGTVYIVNRGRQSIIVMDRNLSPLMEAGYGKKMFDAPAGISAAGSGVLFVADQGFNRITVLK